MPDNGNYPDAVLPIFERSLGVAVQEAHDIVTQAKDEHHPEATILLFSGGNDSNVLLDAMVEHADIVLHVNTGFGIPDTNWFAKSVMEHFAQLRGLSTRVLQPPMAYEELVLTHKVLKGMPGPGVHHIMYQRLKERCVEDLLRGLRERTMIRRPRFLLLTGVRRAESKRRMGYSRPVDRKGGQVWVNPLFHWRNDEMATYRRTFNCPVNEVSSNLHMSGECLCGAMADQDEWRSERNTLRFFYPEFEQRISDLEEECKRKGLPYTEWGVKRPDYKPGSDSSGPMCASCQGRFDFGSVA